MPILLMILAMGVFGILHSILARLSVKTWLRARVGERAFEGFYRLGYNALSVITFLPVVAVLFLVPGPTVWQVSGIGAWVLRLLQLVGLVGLTVSILQIDGWRFLGVSQLVAYFEGKPLPLPDEPLITSGVYGLVRHPLYLFSLMVLWFTPSMQLAGLAFAVTATVYFVVGSLFEERTMAALFGQPYLDYQQRVPWLFPFVKL